MRFLMITFVAMMSFTPPKLVKTQIAEGITVSLPKDFRPMDAMDFTERYPSVRAPIAAYTNENRDVDFSLNVSATQWPDADAALAQKFFKASLFHMFDRVEMVREGIREVNGKKFIFFEFESRVNGTRQDEALRSPVLRYSYMVYKVDPVKTLVFSFNCPQRLRKDWEATAQAIMKSIKIK